ncbi:porin family protein [Aestuariibaculum sediminum]|uniref:PorT family protein n=1 Tax=Aestuariibaculum sediminum TaxID=2770637 RepID=A0A8J6U8J1_9FLAO|nr:porin family protein [Aestuariibaculum sediminum]MBD0831647.1 PorT family protein [Aestuariibaculum sediminum]
MNIKRLTLIIFVIVTAKLIAQNNIRYGAKAGINLSGFHTGKSAFTDNVSFNIGGLAELELSESFSLQAELLYNKKGGLISIRNTNEPTISIDAKLDYIDIPIQAKFEFIKNLSFHFGPQIGFLIDSKGEIEYPQNNKGEEVEFTNTNTIDFALNGGLSLKFNESLFLQARYSYGLIEIFKNDRYKNSVVSLSLGYFFK